MPANITCMVGHLGDGLTLPSLPLTLSGLDVPAYFSKGSQGDIILAMDTRRLNGPALSPDVLRTDSYGLHEALNALTKNQTISGRVNTIGVIYAGYYGPRESAFGVMFDRGFTTSDDPNNDPDFLAIPREGCAIFLNAIKDAYPNSPQEYQTEALFTTIHELGHVFNLQHKQTPPSFLSTSPSEEPFTQEAHHFDQEHISLLAQCSTSDHIWPGGSKFEDLGDLASASDPSLRENLPLKFGLELTLHMEQREFWQFQPVELDVGLHVVEGVEGQFQVPDAVDPGYSQFVIWIEEPSGERRRYRSPRIYCAPRQELHISPGNPFDRDISIFAEAGGYTFRRVGVHRLWATFTIPNQGVLKSNVVEINVLPASPQDGTYVKMRSILRNPQNSRFLYHRFKDPDPRVVTQLSEFCKDFPKTTTGVIVRYALGSSLAKTYTKGRGGENVQEKQKSNRQIGLKHLKVAMEQQALGAHRRSKVKRIIESLQR